jgi:hypothetical protein
MIDIKRLQTLTQEAQAAKKQAEEATQLQKTAEDLRHAQDILDEMMSEITLHTEAIAGLGQSTCAIKLLGDDGEYEYPFKMLPEQLRGLGRLLFDDLKGKGLNPRIVLELRDEPPEYGGASWHYYIFFSWGNLSIKIEPLNFHSRNFSTIHRWINDGGSMCMQLKHPEI